MAALIASILSVILLPVGPLNILVAVAGLVLGIVARSRGSRGMGLAAIILSVVAILLGALLLAALILLFNNPEFQQQLQELQQQAR